MNMCVTNMSNVGCNVWHQQAWKNWGRKHPKLNKQHEQTQKAENLWTDWEVQFNYGAGLGEWDMRLETYFSPDSGEPKGFILEPLGSAVIDIGEPLPPRNLSWVGRSWELKGLWLRNGRQTDGPGIQHGTTGGPGFWIFAYVKEENIGIQEFALGLY